MNKQFLVFGIIVSVVVHVVILVVLSVSSTGTASVAGESAASSTDVPSEAKTASSSETPTEPAQTVPETDVAGSSQTTTVPASPVRSASRRQPSRPAALPNAHSAPVHEPPPIPEAEWVTYTVKKGDRLERLVKAAGCSMSEAARYNKTTVKKLSALKVGQRIKLPKFKED